MFYFYPNRPHRAKGMSVGAAGSRTGKRRKTRADLWLAFPPRLRDVASHGWSSDLVGRRKLAREALIGHRSRRSRPGPKNPHWT